MPGCWDAGTSPSVSARHRLAPARAYGEIGLRPLIDPGSTANHFAGFSKSMRDAHSPCLQRKKKKTLRWLDATCPKLDISEPSRHLPFGLAAGQDRTLFLKGRSRCPAEQITSTNRPCTAKESV